MAARNPATAKGLLPVLIADAPGFEAAFGRLVGLLLTAVAIEMLLRGITAFVHQLSSAA